jgi:hypothetical protein
VDFCEELVEIGVGGARVVSRDNRADARGFFGWRGYSRRDEFAKRALLRITLPSD